MAMTVSLGWFCLGQYAPYNCGNLVWLKNLSNQVKLYLKPPNSLLLKPINQIRCFHHLGKSIKENLQAALSYFKNHRQMMDYATHLENNLPIGSVVTEAACKTLVKQRLCGLGMRWKDQGAKVIS